MDLFPKVFRTEGDLAKFDSSRIHDSILHETGMSEENARKITELAVRRIISSGIKFLSGPHVREIVCSILSEEHFENERKLYTRIGMPIMDYEEMLEQGLKEQQEGKTNPEKVHHWAANRISEEYAHLRILNNEESKAHLYGDLHIHKLRYFDLRPLSQIWDPRMILEHGIPPFSNFTPCCKLKPAANLREAVNHLINWLAMTQNEFCGNQGFNLLTLFLAPYTKGINEVYLKQVIKNLIYEINHLSFTSSRTISPTPILSSPTGWNSLLKLNAIEPHGKTQNLYENYHEECLKLFDALTDIYIEGDDNKNPFNSPKHEILVDNEWVIRFNETYSKVWDEVYAMQTPFLINSSLNFNKLTSSKDYSNFGILQEVCLNLPRLAYTSKDEELFMENLSTNMNMCSHILIKKYETMKQRLKSNHLPLCSGHINEKPIFNLKNQHLSISFVGLNEALKFLTDYELHEHTSAFNLGKKILSKMNNICLGFSQRDKVSYLLSENTSKKAPFRFAKLDIKHFSKSANPQSNREVSYYTNSAHFRDEADIDLIEKIKKQEEYHTFIQNGAIEYIPLNELKESNLNLEDFIKHVFTRSKLVSLKFFSSKIENF